MLNLKKRNLGKQGSKKLPEGVYDSIVIDVRWAEGYAPEEAYEIIYEISNDDGNVYRHREIFKTNSRNLRTNEFETYLADNGIEDIIDFKGKREKLTFNFVESYDGKTYFNITDREFVD